MGSRTIARHAWVGRYWRALAPVGIYIVYWNSYAVAMCNARLRRPPPPHDRHGLGGRKEKPAGAIVYGIHFLIDGGALFY